MSGDAQLFENLLPLETPTFVKFGDGERLEAQGCGRVITPIGSVEAIYVPNLCANLLSVHELNKMGASVCFFPGNPEIRYAGQRFSVSLVGNIFQVDDVFSSFMSTHNELYLWHQRFGHLNFPTVVSFLKRFGVQVDKTPTRFCQVCAQAKLAEKKFSVRHEHSSKILERVHSDIGGPITSSHEGFKYWITYLDEASRYVKVCFLKSKSDASFKTVETLKFLQKLAGCGVAIFRTDGGKEYQSVKVQDFLRENATEHEVTPPYTPELNGMAERLNRTLMERVRCLLVSSGLNHSFWKDAMEYSVYIYNRTPHSGIGFRTPWEVFHNCAFKKLPKFHVFGSMLYYHVPQELRSKIDGTGHRGLFLGFSNTGFLVLSLPDLMIKECRTAAVQDGEMLSVEEMKSLGISQTLSCADIMQEFSGGYEGVVSEEPSVEDEGEVLPADLEDHKMLPTEVGIVAPDDSEMQDVISDRNSQVPMTPSSSSAPEPSGYFESDVEWTPRFGKRRLHEDDEMWEPESSSDEASLLAEQVETVCFISHLASQQHSTDDKLILRVLLAGVEERMKKVKEESGSSCDVQVDLSEPSSFEEAFKNSKWLESMRKEIQSLLENKTWILVDLPDGRKVVKNKWVYKIKSDGRFKSRLVAKGFTQVHGVDFDETWSPVGRKASLKLLIWFVLNQGWSWKQMDVDTAFLNSDLEEEIFMQQPQGFEDGSRQVCKLLKSIYGLKQASRAWYNTLRSFLDTQNLKRSRVDPCIYLRDGLIVFVYVDDIIIAGRTEELVRNLSDQFKLRFKMKDLGEPSRILGLDLVKTSQGILLSGKQMIEDMLAKFDMQGSRYVSTPMDANQTFLPGSDSQGVSQEMQSNYSSAIGSLLYIANTYRPDISYAVSVLSQFTASPSEEHWRGVKRVMRYLNGTRDFGLLFKKSREVPCKGVLTGYSDADYASCFSRKSRSGYVFFINDTVLCWSSKKQSVVALSTCESEYYALTEGGKEAIHLKRLVWEFNHESPLSDDVDQEPLTLFCDNQSAIFVSKNPAEHKMMKHVDVRHKWIQEKVEAGEFQVDYVPTKDQAADILTKALAKQLFERHRDRLGITRQTLAIAREC